MYHSRFSVIEQSEKEAYVCLVLSVDILVFNLRIFFFVILMMPICVLSSHLGIFIPLFKVSS